ncbi:hypothetical protein D3C85_1189420 [compost metagenome]
MISQLAAAHHAIDVLVDQIDDAIADAHVDLDVRVSRMKLRQRRHQNHARKRTGHIHPQSPPGHGRCTRQTGFGIVQVSQQSHHALVVDGAVGGDVNLACGAVEQFHPQPRLQLLHQLRDAGLAHVQRLGGLGEAARLHHPGEGLHRIETVHTCLNR